MHTPSLENIQLAKRIPNEHGGVRTDADAVLFARQVEYQYAETYDIEYPELDMANGDILPIDRSVPAGAKSFVYYTYGGTGIAAVLNTYAANSIPTVGMQAKSTTGTLHDVTLSYAVNIADLEAAAMAGMQLESGLGDACKRGHMLTRDEIGWFGEPKLGLYGLLTHPNITHMSATGLFSGLTAEQIAANVATLINTPRNLTNKVEVVNTVVFPDQVWTALQARPWNTGNASNLTIAEWLQKNHPGVTFKTSITLDSANHASTDFAGSNVIVAYNNSPRKASLVVPKDFTLLPAQWEALQMRVYNHSKVGGAKIPYPLSVAVMRGA